MRFLSGKDKKKLKEVLPTGYFIEKKDDIKEDNNILFKNSEKYLIIKKGTYLPHLKSLAEDSFKSVYIDKGAIPFLLNGADMMRPGIQKIEDGFKKGDIVIVRDENHNKALGVGFALFSSVDMQKQEKGKSLNIFHYFNDEHF